MSDLITYLLRESITTKELVLADKKLISAIATSGEKIVETLKGNGTLYACGNGGSTCDAMHLCEELVGRYRTSRKPLRAMHFMDPATMTCWSNDHSFEEAFARVAEAFCTKNDILIAISTSGKSPNILRAVETAKKNGTFVVGLSGRDGGELAKTCDLPIVIPGSGSERIQEVHITIIRMWCEMIEKEFAK